MRMLTCGPGLWALTKGLLDTRLDSGKDLQKESCPLPSCCVHRIETSAKVGMTHYPSNQAYSSSEFPDIVSLPSQSKGHTSHTD